MASRFFFLILLFWTSLTWADESSVYLCKLENTTSDGYVVRMKKYFDAAQKMELGKVDRLHNAEVLESAPTKVFQIPLLDKESYVQIWFGDQVSLDAQLAYDQGRRPFHAVYKKNNEKLELICQETQD